ncbi:MAG TPA: hypothetical protein DEG47_19415 [Cyanobacteria bacterium UBA11148]|nr:hypothetical protein [Cyanobacteria bacterium UBA11148]
MILPALTPNHLTLSKYLFQSGDWVRIKSAVFFFCDSQNREPILVRQMDEAILHNGSNKKRLEYSHEDSHIAESPKNV